MIHMTSDLSSVLEVCFKRDALNKSMFTLLYFTLRVCLICSVPLTSPRTVPGRVSDLFEGELSGLQCLSHQSLVQYNRLFILVLLSRLSSSSSSFICDAAVTTEVHPRSQEQQLHSVTHIQTQMGDEIFDEKKTFVK